MQKYNDSILALDQTGHWLDEDEIAALEATFGTNDEEKILELLSEYAEAATLAEASCKACREITKTYPKRDRMEAEKAAIKKYLEHDELRQIMYTRLKIALEGEGDMELEEAWSRASRMGLI
jgi:hypothetical protein